jgi:translation initiation factor 2B subunit (eIF-2B alpha/beta/delta family)
VANESWAALLDRLRRDEQSGATALASRAATRLPTLADHIGGDLQGLKTGLCRLATVRPPFASLFRLASRAAEGSGDRCTPPRIAEHLQDVADHFSTELQAQHQAVVTTGADLLRGPTRVLTISASSAVQDTLVQAHRGGANISVTCLESRPGREGVTIANALAGAGIPARLAIDAAAARLVREADLVLVGGDTLSQSGLIHKVGTLGLTLAAHHCGVPVYVLAGSLKFLPRPVRGWQADGGPGTELVEQAGQRVEVWNRYYDLTPLDLLSRIVTEHGLLTPANAAKLAVEQPVHRWLADLLV